MSDLQNNTEKNKELNQTNTSKTSQINPIWFLAIMGLLIAGVLAAELLGLKAK